MSTLEVSDQRLRSARFPWASVVVSCAVAIAFLVSAVLQLIASFERWITFSNSLGPDALSVEGHEFDYFFPWEPWQPIGTAAELLGVALLIQAGGALLMTVGVLALPPQGAHRRAGARTSAVLRAVAEIALAGIAAAWFWTHGLHALQSGIDGAPSELSASFTWSWVGFASLGILAVLWRARSRAAVAACLFLIGSTTLGYGLATYAIAPLFTGGSHDTARWTETVVALTSAAAGLAMLAVARSAARRSIRTQLWTAVSLTPSCAAAVVTGSQARTSASREAKRAAALKRRWSWND